VSSFLTDVAGNTWIGTSNGLRVMHPGSQHIDFFSLDAFGSSERIYPGRLAYQGDEHVIYLISLQAQGLYRIPLDHAKEATFIPSPFPCSAITVDQAGRILVAGSSALYLFDPQQKRFAGLEKILPDDEPMPWLWSMMSDQEMTAGIGPDEFFWFTGHDGPARLLLHDQGARRQQAHSKMFITKDRRALLSGGSHLREVDLATGSERVIKSHDQGHLIQDREGMYWLGTINHIGRYKLDGDSLVLVKYLTAKDGLSNITASHLHLDHRGRVWIFSNSGMSVIDPATYQARNAGVPEGLPISASDPVQVIDLPDGRMSTVNSNGIIVFHPDSLWEAASQTGIDVVIKSIRISGNENVFPMQINFLRHLDLAFRQNTLDIQFQGLAFPNDRHVVYSYQVDRLHEHWIFLGKNNTVSLSKLPPGEYVFRVKAAMPESSAPVKELRFTIARPVYMQAWFLGVCGLLFLGGVFFLYRYRVGLVRRQEEEKSRALQQMGELELQALRAQMNPHFMFNSLNSIKNYILKNESAKAAEYLSSFAHLIRLILQHSREKTISLQEELEVLLLYIDLEKLRFRNGFEFTCRVDDGIDTSQVQLPPMIIQPFIENAIWHGLLHKDDDRHLALRIGMENQHVLCEVEDNGIGREQAAAIKSKSATRYKSMGMGITQDRISLMNTMSALGIRVEVMDKTNGTGKPSGTLVKIHIPNARHTDR
jgi:hypothetical protein